MIQFFGSKIIIKGIKRNFSTKTVSLIKDIYLNEPVGVTKTIQGWASATRKGASVVFIDIRDGSSFRPLQVTISPQLLKDKINFGSSVNVTGTIEKNQRGNLELVANEINLVGSGIIANEYPFTPKRKESFDVYRQHLHFRPRLQYFVTMFRVRSAATQQFHRYFEENDFTLIHTPIITSSSCEDGAETFLVKPESEELIKSMKKPELPSEKAFFDSSAYLTVSGQLHLETITRSISRVYTFNPSFRAENSKSRLHLTEFYMLEAEEAFITNLEDVLHRIQDCINKVLTFLLSNYLLEIKYLLEYNETNVDEYLQMLKTAVDKPFTIMSFSEAKHILNENKDKFQNSPSSIYNLNKEEELFLVKHNKNHPIFVIDWPKNEKPFYMKESSEDSSLVKAVDLLVPNVGELCGGSVREDNYDILKQKLIAAKQLENLSWYLDLRKFGNVPTGGFGLGFERFLQYLLNIQNIKDTIPFPRWPHNLQL